MRSASLLASLVLIAMVAGLIGAQPSATAPAGSGLSAKQKIYVAVMSPEISGDLTGPQRAQLGDWLDALVGESLAHRSDLAAVDRQGLDKLLAEKSLQQSARLDARDVAEPIRPFWSAGILICPTVRQSSDDRLVISLDAVAAQSGQVVAQAVDLGKWTAGGWSDPSVAKKLDLFLAQIGPAVARQIGKPTVEVAAGRLISDLGRLQWMVDDLSDGLRVELAADRAVTVLEPRHAASSKEERLLRLMGLSEASAVDPAAGLRPTPDARIHVELHETVEPNVDFEKTPIALTVFWQNGSAPASSKTFAGTVGQWEDLRQSAMQWAQSQRATLAGAADDQSQARRLAREELDAIAQLNAWPTDDAQLERQRKRRIVEHALRAAHLDPFSEPAGYQVAMNIDALYDPDDDGPSFECENRVIVECQRYLERFAKVAPADRLAEIEMQLAGAAQVCAGMAGPDLGLALSSRQNAEKFHYEAIALPLWIDRFIADGPSANPGLGNLWAASWNLRLFFIMNCPADRLDAEHARWQKIWTERVAKVRGFTPPWDLIEIFFQIRAKNWQKAREAYQRLADQYSESVKQVWYFNRTPILPHTLRAAGDPEWSTWKPTFHSNPPIQIDPLDFGYSGQLYGAPFIDQTIGGPTLPISKIVLKPDLIDHHGIAPLGLLGMTGKQMWMVSPMPMPGQSQPSRIYVADVPAVPDVAKKPIDDEYRRFPREVELPVDPQVIDWPPSNGQAVQATVACALATSPAGHAVMLLGTQGNGIARFDRDAAGKWIGLWYSGRQGLPTDQIDRMAEYAAPGSPSALRWIVTGHDAHGTIIWTIDPHDDSTRIVFRGDYGQFVSQCRAGPDRQLLLATVVNPDILAHGDLDHVPIDQLLDQSRPLVFCQGRLWRIFGRTMTELSPRTLQPIGPVIGSNAWWTFLPDVSDPIATFGPFVWRTTGQPATFDWPVSAMEDVTGTWRGLFMVMDWHKAMAIYTPAPPGEGEWAKHDFWIGFDAPERCKVLATFSDPAGDIWLTTDIGLLRLNRDMIDEYCNRTFPNWDPTTAGYQARWIHSDTDFKFNSNPMWARETARCISQKKWDEALWWVDLGQAKKPTVPIIKEWQKAQVLAPTFWRARVYAEMPLGIDKALALYDQAIASRYCSPSIELNARICQMLILHRAGRYAEVIARYNQTAAKFTQIKNAFPEDALQRIVRDSRIHATTQPAPVAKAQS